MYIVYNEDFSLVEQNIDYKFILNALLIPLKYFDWLINKYI